MSSLSDIVVNREKWSMALDLIRSDQVPEMDVVQACQKCPEFKSWYEKQIVAEQSGSGRAGDGPPIMCTPRTVVINEDMLENTEGGLIAWLFLCVTFLIGVLFGHVVF